MVDVKFNLEQYLESIGFEIYRDSERATWLKKKIYNALCDSLDYLHIIIHHDGVIFQGCDYCLYMEVFWSDEKFIYKGIKPFNKADTDFLISFLAPTKEYIEHIDSEILNNL